MFMNVYMISSYSRPAQTALALLGARCDARDRVR